MHCQCFDQILGLPQGERKNASVSTHLIAVHLIIHCHLRLHHQRVPQFQTLLNQAAIWRITPSYLFRLSDYIENATIERINALARYFCGSFKLIGTIILC